MMAEVHGLELVPVCLGRVASYGATRCLNAYSVKWLRNRCLRVTST
jgi:hypothetical protein